MNRETWLNLVAEEMRPWFKDLGYPLPKFRVAIGFTSTGMRGKAIGECWTNRSSKDGHYEIFIVPTLDDAVFVAAVLAHELCHAAVGIEAGHGPLFGKVARGIGLDGKLTATVPGPKFREMFAPILDKVGPLPHARLMAANVGGGPRGGKGGSSDDDGDGLVSSGPKKQTTRLIKAECGHEGCGYTVRVTKKWIDVAPPICPIHKTPMTIDGGE